MSYRITEEYSVCGACEAWCPEQAVGAGEESLRIDPGTCSDRSTCAEVRPVGASVPGRP